MARFDVGPLDGSDITALPSEPRRVLHAARRGAHSVTSNGHLIREASEKVLQKYEDRVIAGNAPRDPVAWAFVVGAREVRRGVGPRLAFAQRRVPDADTVLLLMRGKECWLTEKMLIAVEAYAAHGSQHAAAKALDVDRSNLRRTLLRALQRVVSKGVDPLLSKLITRPPSRRSVVSREV